MKTPLIQEPKQTNRLWLVLPLVLIVGLIGAWQTDILPKEAEEIPVGKVENVDKEAADILNDAKGPITLYKDVLSNTAEWHKLWMYATPSGYCWSSTAFNALRLIAKPAFDAGLAAPSSSETDGFIRNKKNITPQMRYYISRMKGCSPDTSTREVCGTELWTVNTLPGNVNMMGLDRPNDKECYQYQVAKDALTKISGLGVDGGKCQNTWVKKIKDGLNDGYAVVVAVAFSASAKFIHYLTIGGVITVGGKDWYLILNPANSPATRDPQKPYSKATDDKLYPWGVYELKPMTGSGANSNRIKILDANGDDKFWICFATWVKSDTRKKIGADFDLLKPR